MISEKILEGGYLSYTAIEILSRHLFYMHENSTEEQREASKEIYKKVIKEKISYTDKFFEVHFEELKQSDEWAYVNQNRPTTVLNLAKEILRIAIFADELNYALNQFKSMSIINMQSLLVNFSDLIISDSNFYFKHYKSSFPLELIQIQLEYNVILDSGQYISHFILLNDKINTLYDIYEYVYKNPLFDRNITFQYFINKCNRYQLRRIILDIPSIRLMNELSNALDPIYKEFHNIKDEDFKLGNYREAHIKIDFDKFNCMKIKDIDSLLEADERHYPISYIDLSRETCETFTKENFNLYLDRITSSAIQQNIYNRIHELLDKESLQKHFNKLATCLTYQPTLEKIEQLFTMKDMIEILEGV